MGFTLLGILSSAGSGGASPYWLSVISGSAVLGRNSYVDDSQNTFISFRNNTAPALMKIAPSGDFEWARELAGGSNTPTGVVSNGTDSVYFRHPTGIGKYNYSGALQWQKHIANTSSSTFSLTQANDLAISSDGSLCVNLVTSSAGAGSTDFYVAKVTAAGAISWQRTLGTTSEEQNGGIAVDSSDNIIICGNTGNNFAKKALIAKYNSSGTLQWQRTLDSTDDQHFNAVITNSSGDIYAVGTSVNQNDPFGSARILIAKYNSSGTIQWQRLVSTVTNGVHATLDDLGNLYITGLNNADSLVMKFDSSGTIVWQRRVFSSNFGGSRTPRIYHKDGKVFISSNSETGTGFAFTIVLPDDGSLDGSYVTGGLTVTYSISSFTISTSTFTAATSSLSTSTPSFAISDTAFTSNTITPTYSLLAI